METQKLRCLLHTRSHREIKSAFRQRVSDSSTQPPTSSSLTYQLSPRILLDFLIDKDEDVLGFTVFPETLAPTSVVFHVTSVPYVASTEELSEPWEPVGTSWNIWENYGTHLLRRSSVFIHNQKTDERVRSRSCLEPRRPRKTRKVPIAKEVKQTSSNAGIEYDDICSLMPTMGINSTSPGIPGGKRFVK